MRPLLLSSLLALAALAAPLPGVALPVAAAVTAEEAQAKSPPGIFELTADTFTPTLKDNMPEDRWVLMEFYAHWCPHCQHFQPEYNKVAAFFLERGEQEPVVAVARVDCANHAAVCNKFKVRGYPALKLGQAGDFAAGALDKLIEVQPASRHADSVVAFVGMKLNVKYDLSTLSTGSSSGGGDAAAAAAAAGGAAVGGRKAGAGLVHGAGSLEQEGGEIKGQQQQQQQRGDLNDIEGATITAWQYLAASPLLLKGPEARQALKDWVDLLADAHPSESCMKGAEKAQEALDVLWPDDTDEPEQGLQQVQICPGAKFKEWHSCRGTRPDSRGYTCGLWQLFHTLAARLSEAENSGAVWLAAIKGFVQNYFQCAECAKHFVRHAVGEEAGAVARKRDAVLWIWRTHNIVNRRLAAEEEADASKGDPASPHEQFPPATLCPKCRKAEGQGPSKDEAVPWDEEEVYKFLLTHYSGKQAQQEGNAFVNGSSGGGSGGGRSKRAGWSDAALVLGAVAACLYGVLRRSGQYALRKSESRTM